MDYIDERTGRVYEFGRLTAERDRLKAVNAELVAALVNIAASTCQMNEGNRGAIRAWSFCCATARAAIAKAQGNAP